jgi:fucokinase
MKLMRMSPASFIHKGTTQEVLKLLTEEIELYSHLGWERHIHSNRSDKGFAIINS